MGKVEKIKLLVGVEKDDDSMDELLSLLVSKCETFVRTYCGIFESSEDIKLAGLPAPLEGAALDLAVIRYNKVGSEGLAKEIIGPMTLDYLDVPDSIMQVLNKYKKITF
jgi:hypothetical protein